MKSKISLIKIRCIFQFSFFCLFLYIIWNTRYPVENTLNIKWYFQADPLVMIITSIAERIFLSGLLLSLFTILITLIFGRVFCGWFCPLGAVLDFTAYIKKRILNIFKKNTVESEPGKTSLIKYFILLPLVILSAAGYQTAWLADPLVITLRAFSINFHPAVNSITDSFFGWMLKTSNYNEYIENTYEFLRESFLSITKPEFPHSGTAGLIFLSILFLVTIKKRFWCRYLCPLGAFLALVARYSLFERHSICEHSCGICKNECRMNAIREDNSYRKEECILCLDCTENCPGSRTKFHFKKMDKKNEKPMG